MPYIVVQSDAAIDVVNKCNYQDRGSLIEVESTNYGQYVVCILDDSTVAKNKSIEELYLLLPCILTYDPFDSSDVWFVNRSSVPIVYIHFLSLDIKKYNEKLLHTKLNYHSLKYNYTWSPSSRSILNSIGNPPVSELYNNDLLFLASESQDVLFVSTRISYSSLFRSIQDSNNKCMLLSIRQKIYANWTDFYHSRLKYQRSSEYQPRRDRYLSYFIFNATTR